MLAIRNSGLLHLRSDFDCFCFIHYFVGINLKQRIQEEVAPFIYTIKDDASKEYLKQLSDSLAVRLLGSKSESTAQKYWYSFRKFEQFLATISVTASSVQPIHVALYVTSLLDKGSSFSVASSAVYAIKWVFDLKSLPDPTDNSFVKNILESAKRNATKPVNKKDPVSTDMLISLCKMYQHSCDLLTVRNLCMILLGYAGFLRFNEINCLKCNDVSIKGDYVVLKIRRSKTDQYRDGNTVLISKGETEACPFSMLQRYISLASIDLSSDHFLFKPIYRSKSVCKLIFKNKPLSYTSTRENILKLLSLVGGHLNLGLHSLRSGGATTVANTEVKDRNWKRHGRWKSDSSKDGYVVDSVQSRLEVSKHLGL